VGQVVDLASTVNPSAWFMWLPSSKKNIKKESDIFLQDLANEQEDG